MKKIYLLVAIFLSVLIGYFASLHVSKEKPKTADDIAIRNILEQNTDSSSNDENTLNIIKAGSLNPDARGSDRLHQGEGDVSIVSFNDANKVVFEDNFSVTNGPDYKVYLMTEAVPETEDEFDAVQDSSHNIGDMKQFSGYQTHDIPSDVDATSITGVVIWCESFGEFISSAVLD